MAIDPKKILEHHELLVKTLRSEMPGLSMDDAVALMRRNRAMQAQVDPVAYQNQLVQAQAQAQLAQAQAQQNYILGQAQALGIQAAGGLVPQQTPFLDKVQRMQREVERAGWVPPKLSLFIPIEAFKVARRLKPLEITAAVREAFGKRKRFQDAQVSLVLGRLEGSERPDLQPFVAKVLTVLRKQFINRLHTLQVASHYDQKPGMHVVITEMANPRSQYAEANMSDKVPF